MGKHIPRDTLHRKIHDTIHDIPCPSEEVCQHLWFELARAEVAGDIDLEKDSLEQRLYVLIELMRHCDAELDATIAVLSWQKQVVHKFLLAPSH